jgi:hypothetical protein
VGIVHSEKAHVFREDLTQGLFKYFHQSADNCETAQENVISGMPVKDVRGNIRPELPKCIRESIAAQGITVLCCERSNRPVMAGIVAQRDSLRRDSGISRGMMQANQPIVGKP